METYLSLYEGAELKKMDFWWEVWEEVEVEEIIE